MKHFRCSPIFAGALCVLTLAACAVRPAHAVDPAYWTLTPYKIRVLLAVDSQAMPSDEMAERVAAHINRRADASIGPIWNLTVEPLAGADRMEALAGYAPETLLAKAEEAEPAVDKLMVVTVTETPLGFAATALECDPLLARVGDRVETPPCGLPRAPESAFECLMSAFSPVALFDPIRNKDPRATDEFASLTFRGSGLPTRPGAPVWQKPGDVYMPILRRTNREGEVVENGLKPAPWTFLQQVEPAPPTKEDPGGPRAKVYSHAQRPFGIRRRGRVEYFAVRLRKTSDKTNIHLHVKEKPGVALPGYQAFAQDGADAKRLLVGASDADGLIPITAGDAPIQIVYIKSGSQLVAKTPVPAGMLPQIDIPLLDERERLKAEAKLGLLQEELLDLIARRSILTERIRKQIKDGNKQRALELLNKLDGMPGRAQFNTRLTRAQRQAKSDDPIVQKRIDKLFSDTSIVLGAFLGTSEVDQLRREIAGE